MAGDDEIVVTIEDSADGGGEVVLIDETGVTAGTVAKKPSDDPIASLKTQLAERQSALDTANQRIASSETAVSQATQRVRQAEQEAVEARTREAESQKTTVSTGIAAAKAEADAAEGAYKVAFEAGNAGDAAKAQRRIARAEADMAILEQAKADMGETRPAPKTETRPAAQDDPVEAFIQSRTPTTQNWLRAHRDYLTDTKKNAKMQAAHFDAESEGIPLDSPQYFEHIEKFLGMKKPDAAADQNGSQPSQRRPASAVAPVTQSGGGMGGEGNTVRLTRAEADAATDGITHVWNIPDPTGKNRWKVGDAIGLSEMGRRKLAMTKQGRYNNGNVDGT